MKSFETIAIVGDDGQIRVGEVPYVPGTRVSVSITPQDVPIDDSSEAAAERATKLFAAMDKAQNVAPVGPLNRTELYDRDVLR